MQETILEMQGIVKVFAGVHALNDVRFELQRGEVHALIGENGAGKSTLMKILLGLYEADAGEILLKGEQVHFKSPADALKRGISMIHQEISLVPEMDVAENIWLGREEAFKKLGFLDKKSRYQQTKLLLDELDIHIDPAAKVRELSVANMQLTELARAVSYNSDIIIMDEPTSALTNTEVELLYSIVRKLAASGTAIIFISHKLEEIFEICSRVTVLRDGNYISTENTDTLTMDRLISMIVGREQTRVFEKQNYAQQEVLLSVRDFCQEGVFSDVNFEVRRGEVLGFSGLMGAGRTEIMQALFGLTKPTSGTVLLKGRPVAIHNPREAVEYGIGMVTEDRLRTGAIYTLSVMQNTTIVALRELASKLSLYSHKKEEAFFNKAATTFDVKYSS
ncbi:MAG: sugar ABC transporter ATP-binding protein, partial [Oscillospiraceae bacterium]